MIVLTIVTVLQFCRLRYKMLVRPMNLSLWYYIKDNMVLQALCPSNNCLDTKSKSRCYDLWMANLDTNYQIKMVKLRLELLYLFIIEFTQFLDGSFKSTFFPSLHGWQWPFLYYRRIIRLDELCKLNCCSSDSSSNKFSSIKTGNRRIIRLNT